jgi:hypothetical protein
VRKSRKQEPPRSRSRGSLADSRLGLLELDRFTNTDITRWKKLSDDLDELNDLLYFGIEPQRQRHHEAMIDALQRVKPTSFTFSRWTRLVSWRYGNDPLSAAGSLADHGGRFNIGRDVDKTMRAPWPSLYLGENFETAYREKFQLDRGDRVDGLSPEELALNPGNSFTAVCLDGQLNRVFDVDEPGAFDPLCAVLRKIKLPAQVRQLQYRLKIPKRAIFMLRSASQLRTETLQKNWRAMPVQFGLPALSQILGSLILDAGFEAIRYPSTKGSGSCLAVFPHKLSSSQSYVALSDDPPAELRHARLDMDSADELCGWEMLRTNQQPRNGG